MIYSIKTIGDNFLRAYAKKVINFDNNLRMLVKNMFKTMYHAKGIGLAATQIGVNARVFIWDLSSYYSTYLKNSKGAIVNPNIIISKISGKLPEEGDREGCLSIPNTSYPLKRAQWVRINGFNVDNCYVSFEATGLLARCIQHEFDHINGILYIDKLNTFYKKKALKYIKKNTF